MLYFSHPLLANPFSFKLILRKKCSQNFRGDKMEFNWSCISFVACKISNKTLFYNIFWILCTLAHQIIEARHARMNQFWVMRLFSIAFSFVRLLHRLYWDDNIVQSSRETFLLPQCPRILSFLNFWLCFQYIFGFQSKKIHQNEISWLETIPWLRNVAFCRGYQNH